VAGGVAGIGLAVALARLGAPLVAGLPRLEVIHVDWRSLLFTLAATTTTGLLFGLVPGWWVARADVQQWLKTRGDSEDVASTQLRRFLVGGEIALAVVLLVSAGLLLKSFARLAADRGGVDPRGVLTFAVRLPDRTYADARAAQFVRALSERLAALPGVDATGAVSVLPFSGAGAQAGFRPFGSPRTPENERRTDNQVATPGYFRALGIELLRGRVFTDQDRADAPKVAVVDERFAQAFWPGQDPIGQRVTGWGFDTLAVIGVVRHVKNYGVAATSRQEIYVPHNQRPFQRMTFVVRAAGNLATLLPSVRRAVAALDANLPIYEARSMDDVIAGTTAGPRLAAVLSGSFATIAVLLAVIGIAGVTGYVVTRRTREIGLRMALGATANRVVYMVVVQTMRLATAGVGLGILASVAATRILRGQVYGVSVTDAATFLLVPALLLSIAAAASAVPALRAARVSPVVALTEE
jgi:predicted permease